MHYWQLQRPSSERFDDRIIAVYRTMYDAFFEECADIPPGRFCEVRYEDLIRAPIPQTEAIYEALGLPGVAAVRARLEPYLASIGGYQTNTHPGLAETLRRRITHEWQRSFEEWGYDR
jgi:hypothetical protein